MENLIAVIVLVVLVGGAVAYIVKSKRSGVKCFGCPAGGGCPSARRMKKKKLSGPVIGKKTLMISGMECAHCAQSVTESLNQIDGVRAKVDLAGGKAIVSFDRNVEDEVLKKAVEKFGYKVNSITA